MANRWLIVGLGNPGPEYANTRHNIGALVVERMAAQSQAKFSSHKARVDIAEIRLGVGGETPVLILARPRSYMNESGGPVKGLADYFSIAPDQIIVIHDELDIDFNSIRVKLGGGDNGHNGLKSVTQSMGSGEYYRIRMGIGRPLGQQDPADFVLKQFASQEKKDLEVFLAEGGDAIESLITQGLEKTQQDFNS
jgi:PTH1 family peptidyl-tRNA hydrolase